MSGEGPVAAWRKAVWLSAAGVAIGSVMPWAVYIAPFFGRIELVGVDIADGRVTLALAVAVAVATFVGKQWARALAAAAASVAALVAAGAMARFSDAIAESNADELGFGAIGWGLWLTLFAACVCAASTVVEAFDARRRAVR